MKIHLSRWVCLDPDSNFRRLENEVGAAADAGASVVVFPESFLHGYTREVQPAVARDHFRRLSQAHPDVLLVFGTFSEDRRNRLTAWLGGGEAAHYDKVHLFEPNGEPALWEAGDRYVALRAMGRTWGFLTCNDLRFPEQARALKLRGRCEILIVPAWWPWRRDHVWAALLQARAIENAAWVLGCCVAASEVPGEVFAGAGNHVFDPAGEPVRTADDRTYEIDLSTAREPVVDPLVSYVEVDRLDVLEV